MPSASAWASRGRLLHGQDGQRPPHRRHHRRPPPRRARPHDPERREGIEGPAAVREDQGLVVDRAARADDPRAGRRPRRRAVGVEVPDPEQEAAARPDELPGVPEAEDAHRQVPAPHAGAPGLVALHDAHHGRLARQTRRATSPFVPGRPRAGACRPGAERGQCREWQRRALTREPAVRAGSAGRTATGRSIRPRASTPAARTSTRTTTRRVAASSAASSACSRPRSTSRCSSAIREANSGRFGLLRADRRPLPICRASVEVAYGDRLPAIGCVNPEFAEPVDGEPFRITARV